VPRKVKRKKRKIDPGRNNLTGAAGEYFVAGELSRKGYIASLTMKNTIGIDIIASRTDGSHTVNIQVKTKRHKGANWVLSKKADTFVNDSIIYVFVDIHDENERPKYYVVPSKLVAKHTKTRYTEWMRTPGRRGQKHRGTSMRHWTDDEGLYLENWNLLGLGDENK